MPTILTDRGHGKETAGKRTPSYNGQVTLEWYLNDQVENRLIENLQRCGFKTMEIANTTADMPLSERIKKANATDADFYLSIHHNAFDGSFAGAEARGIETYAHFGYPKTVAKARILHKWLMKGSPLPDRGVKNGDWLYVLKNTKMEAALVELGFMDSLHDIKYILSPAYWQECADELAQAFCEMYNMKWIPKPIPKPVATIDPKTFYRVVAGSFNDREGAEQRQALIKQKAGVDSFLDVIKL
jgi:N-acetylmuramoyl-L-alanine amidase